MKHDKQSKAFQSIGTLRKEAVCHLVKVAETTWCQRVMIKYLPTSAQFWAVVAQLNFPISSPGDSNVLN